MSNVPGPSEPPRPHGAKCRCWNRPYNPNCEGLKDRPKNLVKLKPEDQKILTEVGDFWAARTTMVSLWRDEDGTLWADPVEYAAWCSPTDGEANG